MADDEKLSFVEELEKLINRHSMENRSNTPDYILAEYLGNCLYNFNDTVVKRAKWYGRMDSINGFGEGSVVNAGD